jgi:F-type H+-transporting ATPase subunit gamma
MSGKLKEVRERMKSVQSTQQITSAMKMVSAAKLRRAQDMITRVRPYANKFDSILYHLLESLEESADTPYAEQREVSKAIVVVMTSDRGLCGAFNTNIIKKTVAIIDEKYAAVRNAGNLSIMCIGKRGFDYFRKRYTDCNIIDEHVGLFQHIKYIDVEKVINKLLEQFLEREYDAVDVVFGRFKNPATQYPENFQLLPIPIKEEKIKARRADYIFEPKQHELLQQLIPSILRTDFFRCMLDTSASEHGARMTAMEKATENAKELLRDLRITYNKARQEAITTELSEIVGGAAALEG